MMHLKVLKKQEQTQISKWKEIIKIRAEINEMEMKRAIQRINEQRHASLKR
jgi:hypothetical protein